MDQCKRAGLAQQMHILLTRVRVAVVVILRAGQQTRWAQRLVNGVVVVEDHGPPGVMIAHFGIAPIAVLVPRLHLAAGFGEVTMPMRVHDEIRPQHAAQRAANGGMPKHLLHFGHSRQNVVAGVALLGHHFLNAPTHGGMKVGGKIGLEDDVAVRDKVAHLRLG